MAKTTVICVKFLFDIVDFNHFNQKLLQFSNVLWSYIKNNSGTFYGLWCKSNLS